MLTLDQEQQILSDDTEGFKLTILQRWTPIILQGKKAIRMDSNGTKLVFKMEQTAITNSFLMIKVPKYRYHYV